LFFLESDSDQYRRIKLNVSVDYIKSAIEQFRRDVGAYPPNLESLLVNNNGLSWHGPYIEKKETLIDPYGTPFEYKRNHQNSSYVLYSRNYSAINKKSVVFKIFRVAIFCTIFLLVGFSLAKNCLKIIKISDWRYFFLFFSYVVCLYLFLSEYISWFNPQSFGILVFYSLLIAIFVSTIFLVVSVIRKFESITVSALLMSVFSLILLFIQSAV
jgi:hypothetical protein